MNNIKPRLLKASEISCRVQSLTKNNGVIILLYKDARTEHGNTGRNLWDDELATYPPRDQRQNVLRH